MSDLVEIFMGFEHTVKIVQLRLSDEVGIQSLIRNEFASGAVAGFGGGTLSSVRLYVRECDASLALSYIEQWEKG